MYDGLWTNGNKEAMEFFDYTHEDHFKTPHHPVVYHMIQKILEYIMMKRVTQHEDIFQHVRFDTAVASVPFDETIENSSSRPNKAIMKKAAWWKLSSLTNASG